MRKRHILGSIIYILAFTLILVTQASCSTPHIITTPIKPLSDDQETTFGNVMVEANARESTSEVKEPVVTQEMSINDGRPILENICAQCHLVQSLLEIKKSRIEWEGVLQQMEIMGVHLSENEKVTLLDYLATSEKH
jgi:hypothetical protein